MLKKILLVCVAVFASQFAPSADAQNPLPLKWRWGDGFIGARNGLDTCQQAFAEAIQIASAFWPAQGRGTVKVTRTPDCAAANAGSEGFFTLGGYRLSDDFPTTSDKDVHINGHCDTGSSPAFTPGVGSFCPVPNPSTHKSAGDCGQCKHGNPILPGELGNKLQKELDYAATGVGGLKFERTYNSYRSLGTKAWVGVGSNWTHTYARKLYFGGPDPSTITMVGAERQDGRTLAFARSGTVYVSDPDVADQLEAIAGGWKLTTVADEVELYDSQGLLQSITDRAGLVTTFTYFSAAPHTGMLQTVTDPFGRTLQFQYNAKRQMISMTNPGGGQTTYEHAPQAVEQMVKVTYPDTRSRTYHYNPGSFQLTGITDELGIRYSTYAYGIGGRAVSTELAGGVNKVTFEPGATGNDTIVTFFQSPSVSVSRNFTHVRRLGIDRNVSVGGPPCPSCGPASQAYDARGNVATVIDWNGNRSDFAYDARNLETTRVNGRLPDGSPTPQFRRVSTAWHASFRLPAQIAEPLRMTTNVYDLDGTQCGARGAVCSKSIQATTDADGSAQFAATPSGSPRVWTYTYNANGQVLTMDGPRTDVSDVTTYTYYANNDADINKRGHMATLTNAAGHTTSVTSYNAHGQPLSMVDANGLTTTMEYDERQRLTKRTVGNEITDYDYDAAGQLTKVTLPDGSFLSYSYDAAHRLTGIQDNLGNRIAYTLDFQGNRTREEVFDPANQLAQTRSRLYSSINRLFQELGAQNQTTEYGYDNQGNVTSVKDPNNNITTNQYDPLNRLKQTTSPAPVSAVTQYAYNGLDALVQVTDPRNLATTYTVNGLGDVTRQQSPDTGVTVNTYDSAGNLATQTDAKGQVTTYAYDALNRVTLITFHDGARQAYAYDQGANGVGRLSSITETNAANAVTSVIAYAYDQHGRVTAETRTVGGQQYVLGYSYDSFGRLSGLTYPSGRTITYGFDALGRVNQVATTKDNQSQVVVQNVQYHPFGGAKSWTLGNGQIYSRAIDQDGRIASYTLGNASVAIGYDAASRITGIGANLYGYDELDRLTSATLPDSSFNYGYDGVGNRLTKTVGAATETYTYSPTSNRIATVGNRSFVFDANGSTTDDAQNQYVYDTRGRMVQATSTLGATTYQVNALGQRVRKTNTLGDTIFHYDTRGKLVAETDPGGVLKRELIYLGDVPVFVVQ